MSNSFFRTAFLTVAVSILAMLAWGQGSALKPGQAGPKTMGQPLVHTPAYLLSEIQKLKIQTKELRARLDKAESRLSSAEAKNVSQDTKIAGKQDVPNYGPDYAGGGWCTKQIFLTTLDNNKTMIHYITVK